MRWEPREEPLFGHLLSHFILWQQASCQHHINSGVFYRGIIASLSPEWIPGPSKYGGSGIGSSCLAWESSIMPRRRYSHGMSSNTIFYTRKLAHIGPRFAQPEMESPYSSLISLICLMPRFFPRSQCVIASLYDKGLRQDCKSLLYRKEKLMLRKYK